MMDIKVNPKNKVIKLNVNDFMIVVSNKGARLLPASTIGAEICEHYSELIEETLKGMKESYLMGELLTIERINIIKSDLVETLNSKLVIA